MSFISTGRLALPKTWALTKKITKRTAVGGGILGVGAGAGYYLGHHSSATRGLTSQNRGIYNYPA